MAIEKRTYADAAKAKAAAEELTAKGYKEVTVSKATVAVNAAFGEGAAVAKILDSFGPVATPAPEAAAAKAPFKPFEWAKWKESATPLSDYFGWSVLKGADYKSPFWPKALDSDPTPLSNKMGWKVLGGVKEGADPATPFSSWLGWAVLKDASYKTSFWPKELLNDATPLSNKLGWSVLRDK